MDPLIVIIPPNLIFTSQNAMTASLTSTIKLRHNTVGLLLVSTLPHPPKAWTSLLHGRWLGSRLAGRTKGKFVLLALVAIRPGHYGIRPYIFASMATSRKIMVNSSASIPSWAASAWAIFSTSARS